MSPKELNSRFEFSVPLPDTFRNVFLNIPSLSQALSSSENGKKIESCPDLQTRNHVFYVGNLMRTKLSEQIKSILGWGEQENRIYSEDYIQAVLATIFSNLEPGEQGVFTIGNVLSELFNGKIYTEKCLTADEIKQKIYDIAKRKFKKGKESLVVESLEKQALHQALFQKLRECFKSESKELDINQTLGVNEEIKLNPQSNSLEIAQFLYQVIQKNEVFGYILTKKENLPEKLQSAYEEFPAMRYYTLVEIAIRLAEILDGRQIHGGADRQGKYDDIVIELIKGKEGKYRNNLYLEKLFNLLQDKKLKTLHLITEKNPFLIRKKKIQAWVRLGIYGVLGGLLSLGIYQQGQQNERVKQEKIKEMTDEQVKIALPQLIDELAIAGIHFVTLSKEESFRRFEEVLNQTQKDLELRYNIPKDIRKEIFPLMAIFFAKHPQADSLLKNYIRIDALDQFVRMNKNLLKLKGINIEQPYQKLWDKLGEHKQLLTKNEPELKEDIPETQTYLPYLRYIGHFETNDEVTSTYDFFEDINSTLFVKVVRDNQVYYSEKMAQEGLRKLQDARQRFEAMALNEYNNLFSELLSSLTVNRNDYLKKFSIPDDNSSLKKIGTYHGFELAVWTELIFSNEHNASFEKKYLLARKIGSNNFNTEDAIQAAIEWYPNSHSHFPDNLRFEYEKFKY